MKGFKVSFFGGTMSHQINIRVPTRIDLGKDTLDPNKFQKSTEKSGGKEITVLTYNDKPGKTGMAKLREKIVNFFTGVKKAKESLTASKAWLTLGVPMDSVMPDKKTPRFNTNLIVDMTQKLYAGQKTRNNDTLYEIVTPDAKQKYSFTLTRTDDD